MNLLEMMKLHGHLAEKEINMGPPLHGAHKVGLWKVGRKMQSDKQAHSQSGGNNVPGALQTLASGCNNSHIMADRCCPPALLIKYSYPI